MGSRGSFVAIGLLALPIVATVAGALTFGWHHWQAMRIAEEAELRAEEREAESAAAAKAPSKVTTVAPAPLPKGLPLVERPGSDAFGYPRSYVDGPGLRSLLQAEKFLELSQAFAELQRRFEGDHKTELWLTQAAETFVSAEPEVRSSLEAWVEATPDAFAPYLALGAHWLAVAATRREVRLHKAVPGQAMIAMAQEGKTAEGYLTRALALEPKLLVATQLHIRLGALLENPNWVEPSWREGIRICRECFALRVEYVRQLSPRFGGSLDAMARSATTAPIDDNPRLVLLPGYVDLERSRAAREANDLIEAMKATNAACSLGPHADFLRERGEVLLAQHYHQRARKELDAAIELQPNLVGAHLARARSLVHDKPHDLMAEDVLFVMRVNPTAPARELASTVVDRVADDAWSAHERGTDTEALRLFELALALAPDNQELQQRREMATPR